MSEVEVVEVVDTVSASRSAVAQLEREPYVAVDCEGVHMSRTGPITLVQVGTSSGHVYLFDVMKEPQIFKDGGLKGLLEDGSVLKVLHAARNDAEALYFQHDVVVASIHDTQLAEMEVERGEGRLFPLRKKLQEIVHMYCPEKEPLLEEGKADVQTKWHKLEGEYWAKRPLTAEMKRYAANDVSTIIPEVYEEQKRLIKQKGLDESYAKRMEEDIRRTREQPLDDKLKQEEKGLVVKTLKTFAETPGASTKSYPDIDDVNVQRALSLVWMQEIGILGLPPFIKQLKTQQIETKLDEIQQELDKKGDDIEVDSGLCGAIYGFATHLDLDPALRKRASDLNDRITNIVLDDVKRKYTMDTPAGHLAKHEKLIVSRRLRPKGATDPSMHPVLLKLHWKLKLEDLEDNIARYNKDKAGFKPTDGYVKMLKFFFSARSVPADIKGRATWFLQELQTTGKVSRPPAKRSRSSYDDDDYYI